MVSSYSTPFKAKSQGQQEDLTHNFRIFPRDYFSFCDMAIYFGDVFIDEITGLQFAMQENVLPLYGYADYRFRTLSHGSRIIQGNFSINFKEAGYIYLIMEALRARAARAEDKSKTTLIQGSNLGLASRDQWTMNEVEKVYAEWLRSKD
jgi:hypothetical protein